MKNLRTPAICVCFTLYSLCMAAQNSNNPIVPVNEPDQNKPKMFQNFPDFIPVDVYNLNHLLTSTAGRNINTNLSSESIMMFKGEVINASSKFENGVSSVVIRSTNFNGATLTISRITNPDGTIRYAGRLMSFKHADLYEIQNRENRLFLVKRSFYELINE